MRKKCDLNLPHGIPGTYSSPGREPDAQELEPASGDTVTGAGTGRRATWAAQGDDMYLPIRPPNDTYLVPEAPQSHVALEYRLPTHHRP
eukprot:2187891-Prymnesium_polylepis.1